MDTDPLHTSQTMVSVLGNAGAAKGGPAVPGKTSVMRSRLIEAAQSLETATP